MKIRSWYSPGEGGYYISERTIPQRVKESAIPLVDASVAEHYKKQRDDLLAFIQRAPVGSGVCCCGDDMERHGNPMDCGHSPVDQWDYSVRCAVERINKMDAEMERKEQ